MVLTQAVWSFASGTDGSKRCEPLVANSLASRAMNNIRAPTLPSLTLLLKSTLINFKGGGSQKIKRILWVTIGAAREGVLGTRSNKGYASSVKTTILLSQIIGLLQQLMRKHNLGFKDQAVTRQLKLIGDIHHPIIPGWIFDHILSDRIQEGRKLRAPIRPPWLAICYPSNQTLPRIMEQGMLRRLILQSTDRQVARISMPLSLRSVRVGVWFQIIL